MIRLIQFLDNTSAIRIARAERDSLYGIDNFSSVYEMVKSHLDKNDTSLTATIDRNSGNSKIDYEQIVREKRILPPITHPDASRLWLTGTGLTHLGSASSRDAMHKQQEKTEGLTDSMKMFLLGIEGGKPGPGETGVQPEWFYKGNGHMLVSPEGDFVSPPFADDGGEEPEVCGVYVVDSAGTPWRIGFATGNEFSDHVMEKKNYLYLAHSKIRPCSFGPELMIGDLPEKIKGTVKVIRDGNVLWQSEFLSGEENMSHSISNLEHHHFKYSLFRSPGDVHVHFFGTSVISYAAGVRTQDGDRFEIDIPDFGKPLRNTLRTEKKQPVVVKRLTTG